MWQQSVPLFSSRYSALRYKATWRSVRGFLRQNCNMKGTPHFRNVFNKFRNSFWRFMTTAAERFHLATRYTSWNLDRSFEYGLTTEMMENYEIYGAFTYLAYFLVKLGATRGAGLDQGPCVWLSSIKIVNQTGIEVTSQRVPLLVTSVLREPSV